MTTTMAWRTANPWNQAQLNRLVVSPRAAPASAGSSVVLRLVVIVLGVLLCGGFQAGCQPENLVLRGGLQQFCLAQFPGYGQPAHDEGAVGQAQDLGHVAGGHDD